MKLALVFDAPRSAGPFGGVAGAYLQRTLEACEAAGGLAPTETDVFYAVAEPQPAGKAPPIKLVRAQRERLILELRLGHFDAVLSMGSGALNSLAASPRVRVISKERGRMRMLALDEDPTWDLPWVPTVAPGAVVKSPDVHRDFSSDVYKVLTQKAPLPAMPISLKVPQTVDELVEALAEIDSATIVGVDVETTGLRPFSDSMLAVGIGAVYDMSDDVVAGVAVVADRTLLADESVQDVLWDAVWRSSRRSAGHNFKFDMQFLSKILGWPPEGAVVGDTMLLAHLLDERPNSPKSRIRGFGLKDIVAVRYDHDYGFDFGQFYETPEDERDYDAMHRYLAEDVCYTARLWSDLEREAREESVRLLECHDTLVMPVAVALSKGELGGTPVDEPWVRETVAVIERRIERRRRALEAALPAISKTGVQNVLAPGQVADVMYDEWRMTPDVRKHGVVEWGDRSTDRDHVQAAVAKYIGGPLNREARWLRSLDRLRKDTKSKTTYEKSVLGRLDSDGRVRASFLMHGTATGRLSSREPNMQNFAAVDREGADVHRPPRRAFRPRDGWDWVEVDYSQLELRVAAGLAGDTAFADVFKNRRDIYFEVASQVFSKPVDQISKAERFLTKAIVLGVLYGRGAKALAGGKESAYVEQKLGGKAWTEEQAAAFIKKFLRSYPQLAAWIERLHREVPEQGYVESVFGRRRRFPLLPKSRWELGSIQRQAVNTPVQSAASDLCLKAMVTVRNEAEAQGLRARVLFPVHDSICIECDPRDLGDLERICREAMETDFMGVPLTVDFEHGPTWADVHPTGAKK